MSYLPQIAWSTIVSDVVLLSPTTYRVTISPLDINEPGATAASVAIGYYLEDYVGYKYTITAINVGGNPLHIEVNDDFGVGYGPQSGQIAYIYKSVGEGLAPYIAPIKYARLDETALDYSRAIELDILWKGIKRNFIELLDCPSSYVDQALKSLRVNATADGIEFWNISDGFLPLSAGSGFPLTGTLYGTIASFLGDIITGGRFESASAGTPEFYLSKLGTIGFSIRNDGSFKIYNWQTGTNALSINSGNEANFSVGIDTPSLKLPVGAGVNKVWQCTNETTGAGQWGSVSTNQHFVSTWNATTNVPVLADGVGTNGYYHLVEVGGTINLGSGNITFAIGDKAIYNGTVWQREPKVEITGFALTKTDDTNIGITLGGSPSIALLNAVSIAINWIGTLADSRIASAATWNAKQPAGSYIVEGDTRLTNARPASDVYTWAKAATKPAYGYGEITGTPILNYLPLTGGTLTGALAGTSSTFSGGITSGGIITSETSGIPEFYLSKLGTRGWSIKNDGNFNIYNYESGSNKFTIANDGTINTFGNTNINGNVIYFNESGVRSWTIGVSGGNLRMVSGDGAGSWKIDNTTVSASPTMGALVIAGGIGIGGAGNFSGSVTALNFTTDGHLYSKGINLTKEKSGIGFNRYIGSGTIYDAAKGAFQIQHEDKRLRFETYNGATGFDFIGNISASVGSFSDNVTTGAAFISRGQLASLVPQSSSLDFSGGNMRLLALGADALTVPGFQISLSNSTTSLYSTPFVIDPSGAAAFSSSVTAAGIIYALGGNSTQWNAKISFPGFGTTHALAAYGDHTHAYEPQLGNPSTNGYVLSSSTAGVRSWIIPQSGPQGIQGPIGATGSQGPQGIQGATGPQGAAGTNGTVLSGTGYVKANGSIISYDPDVVTASADIYASRAKALSLVTLTQAEYDAIGTKDANTLYIIS